MMKGLISQVGFVCVFSGFREPLISVCLLVSGCYKIS